MRILSRPSWRLLIVPGVLLGLVGLFYGYLVFAPTGYTRLVVTAAAEAAMAMAKAAMDGPAEEEAVRLAAAPRSPRSLYLPGHAARNNLRYPRW